MALTRQTMTDEQRKSVALEYLKALDNGGVTSSGGSILELFADDAQVCFPKWGLATGKDQIGKLFGDVGGTFKSIAHEYATLNWIFSGSDLVVCEGTSSGEHRDGRLGLGQRHRLVRRRVPQRDGRVGIHLGADRLEADGRTAGPDLDLHAGVDVPVRDQFAGDPLLAGIDGRVRADQFVGAAVFVERNHQ